MSNDFYKYRLVQTLPKKIDSATMYILNLAIAVLLEHKYIHIIVTLPKKYVLLSIFLSALDVLASVDELEQDIKKELEINLTQLLLKL